MTRVAKCSRDPPVPVLKRVDLREAMVQPRRFHLRSHIVVLVVKSDEAVHFGRDVLGRAVLVRHAIRSRGIVGPALVLPTFQRDLNGPTQGVPSLDEGLIARHELVKLLDVARRERKLAFDG